MARRISEVSRFARLATLIYMYALSLCSCENASISLSPLGMVTVCPGGQVLLTCERINGSVLYWDVSVPHITGAAIQRIVPNHGVVLSSEFRISFTEFNITRTSDSPLTSQLLINNVTTEINGSAIYCSEDGDENNAPMTVINVEYKGPDEILGSMHRSLNVIMVNQLLRSDDVTITLQWLREPGAVYNVSISPKLSLTELASKENTIFTMNLTISYNVQYNVSIISSLCGVATTRILKYADCELPLVDRNLKLNYISTLEGSLLTLTCENEIFNFNMNATEEILNVTCHSNGNWIPNPADFIQSCTLLNFSTTVSPTTEKKKEISTGVIVGSVLVVLLFSVMAIIITISAILIKKGFLYPKRVNRPLDIRLENPYHSHAEQSSSEQPVLEQDTLVYADIGPSSFKNRSKPKITLKPDDMDDRVEYALLNHSLLKPVITTNQDSMADNSLNLDTLLIQLRGAVTPHWYRLGEALEVSKDVLDRCSNYPPEESIVEVLDQWLRNFPGRPTWRDVANALRRTGFQKLANDIEMVYETGKLPIQGDDNDAQQVFSTTASALELNKLEEDYERRKPTFNNCQDQNELAPPLPPKPLAESDMPIAISTPPRPPKYTAK